MFNVPLQEVALEDVKVDVHSYAMADLAAAVNENGAYSMRFGEGDDTEITLSEADAGEADADTEMNGSKIYADDGDAGETVRLTVSDNPNMVLDVTREVIDKCQYVSTVAWSSPYYLQDVRLDSTKSDGSTLYVTDMKTTILGNKAKESSQTVTYMEMRKIDKVVYVHDDGTEQVLWQENNK